MRAKVKKTTITFITNPISGTQSKANVPTLIEEVIDKERFDYEIVNTEYAGHATEIARDAVEKGRDIVAAVGGDGTVNEVARALVDSTTALAVVPCGSGNGLARHLLIPMDVRKSLEFINECEIHELDYGTINNHPFFCTCGMGFDAHISKKFAEAGKRGKLTYAEKILTEGLKYKAETYAVEIDGEEQTYDAYVIT